MWVGETLTLHEQCQAIGQAAAIAGAEVIDFADIWPKAGQRDDNQRRGASMRSSGFGRSALNCRFTRSNGHGARLSATVVLTAAHAWRRAARDGASVVPPCQRYRDTLALQLSPDLISAVDTQIECARPA